MRDQPQTNVLGFGHKLLIVDAIGAAGTACATYFLLAWEVIKTGLPSSLLSAMAVIAACFVAFDITVVIRRVHPVVPLRIIACLNLSYCILVIAALCLYRDSVTWLGLAYFGIETAIVMGVATLELIVANNSLTRSGSC